MTYQASAPGSLMLLGEYGVLYGGQALVCAVDKCVTVTLTPRKDSQIRIQSEMGNDATDLSQLQIKKPFQFVSGVLTHYHDRLKQGCDIDIESEMSHQAGLGTSAAVTVAMLAAVMAWLDIRMTPLNLIRQGRMIIRQVQGMGSGADIAASVYGGMVAYAAQPVSAEKLTAVCPLSVLYAGFKRPTVEVVKQVHQQFVSWPHLFRELVNGIGQCAKTGIRLARQQDWAGLGKIMNTQQGLMEALGVSTPLLHDMVFSLRSQSGMYGSKISGSGLGDCVVGLGSLLSDYRYTGGRDGVQHLPVSVGLEGVQCEKT